MNLKRLAFTLVILAACASIAAAQCVVRHRVIAAASAVVAPVVTPVATVLPAYGATFDASAAELPKLREQLAALQARVAVLETARDNLAQRLAVAESKVGIAAPPTSAAKAAAPKDGEKCEQCPTPTPAPASAKAPSTTPATAAAKGAIPAVYVRSCAACHQAGANPKGGLALVDASGKKLANLTPEDRLEVLRRINLPPEDPQVMPPPPAKAKPGADPKIHEAVSDADAAELMELLTRRK